MATLWRRCATVPQPSELRFGVVRAVGRGIRVLDGRPRHTRERGGFWGFFLISQWEMPLGRWRWNVSDSYAKTWQHFRSANVSWKARFVGFWLYIRFQHQRRGLWEISKNNNDYSTKTQMPAAKCCCSWCDDSRCRRRQAAGIFTNSPYGAVLHCPRPGQPAAMRRCPKITLGMGRLVLIGLCTKRKYDLLPSAVLLFFPLCRNII